MLLNSSTLLQTCRCCEVCGLLPCSCSDSRCIHQTDPPVHNLTSYRDESLVQESSVNWERHAEYMLWLAHRWSDKQYLSLLPRVEVTQRKRCFHTLYAALNSCLMNCMAEKSDVKWADCVKGYHFVCVEMREAFKWAAKLWDMCTLGVESISSPLFM